MSVLIPAVTFLAFFAAPAPDLVGQEGDWRTIVFEAREVTDPDVAVSPDGQWLVFTMVGKLFRLPVKGGEAAQLTFGPYFDTKPAISPDGNLVAFESDRDGSEGNVFVLDLATEEIVQITHERWAGRPTWTLDGRALDYLRFEREAWYVPVSRPRRPAPPSVVRRVPSSGGEPETLCQTLGEVGSVFHLADGRVGWTVVEREIDSPRAFTRIDVLESDGNVATVRVLEGIADRIVASPSGDGIYARRYLPMAMKHALAQERELVLAPIPDGPERSILPVSGISGYNYSGEPGFAVNATDEAAYLGNLGHLWKVDLPSGRRENIPFRADVTLEIRDTNPEPDWTPIEPGQRAPVRTISEPRISPDGSFIVFRALGHLWRQGTAGGEAVRVTEAEGTEEYPTFSPDGHYLAFVHYDPDDTPAVHVLDLQNGEIRAITVPSRFFGLTWSRHGELVGTVSGRGVIGIDPKDGSYDLLTETSRWDPNAQLSADGKTLYFQANASGAWATMQMPDSVPGGWLYRMSLDDSNEAEALLPVGIEYAPPWISPDEEWVALGERNRQGIRLASLSEGAGAQPDVRLFSEEGGRAFAFTPDGSSLLYVNGNTLSRQPLRGGPRQEIPIRLSLDAPTPAPVLLRGVRILDFDAGGFSAETSLLIEGGRIRSIGSAPQQQLPAGTVTLEANGRFALPGLFDTHTHGNGCIRRRYLGYGITSVRNMGFLITAENLHADRGDFSSDAVPRCFYAGELLEGRQGKNGPLFVHPYNEDDARAIVRLLHEQGAQFIKLYHVLPWPLQRAASEEAHHLGLPVAAHGTSIKEVSKGVTLGHRSLTHVEGPFYEDVLKMLAHAGTRWEPTIGVTGAADLLLRDEPERLAYGVRDGLPIGDDALRGSVAAKLGTMGAAYQNGVTLLAGTDYGPYELALHWELEFLVGAGIPPLEVLRIATQSAADLVGAGDHLGSLEVGKLADIVLLDENPLEDIQNTKSTWRVIKGGWVFDPKELRRPGSL